MAQRPRPGCARPAALLFLGLIVAAAPAAAQAPEPGLPRVLYGAPSPQVLYGSPSTPDPAPEPRRAPPAAPPAAIPPQAPQGSLTYGSGPAYLPPPGWWGGSPPYWGGPPSYWGGAARPVRPPPPAPTPYVSPERGRFEPPLPQGRYVGRPPSAPPEPLHGRPRRF